MVSLRQKGQIPRGNSNVLRAFAATFSLPLPGLRTSTPWRHSNRRSTIEENTLTSRVPFAATEPAVLFAPGNGEGQQL